MYVCSLNTEAYYHSSTVMGPARYLKRNRECNNNNSLSPLTVAHEKRHSVIDLFMTNTIQGENIADYSFNLSVNDVSINDVCGFLFVFFLSFLLASYTVPKRAIQESHVIIL